MDRKYTLFRTASVSMVQAKAPEAPPIDMATIDLTDLVGHEFDEDEWAAIVTESGRRYGSSWVLNNKPSGDLVRFTGLVAKYEVRNEESPGLGR